MRVLTLSLSLLMLAPGCDDAVSLDESDFLASQGSDPILLEGDDHDGTANPTASVLPSPTRCEDFVTDPHNSCDGHTDFALTVTGVSDADGDGLWSEGEALTVSVSLYSAAEHMWYPGILMEGDGAEVTATYGNEWWYYGIFEDATYEEVFTFERGPSTADTLDLVFTTAALSCQSQDPEWSDCPHPSPLIVEIALD